MTEVVAVSPERSAATRRHPVHRLLRDPFGVFALFILAIVAASGLLAPWVAPYPPNLADLAAVNLAPGSEGHLLGGDGSGRDILSRLMWGAQQTLIACAIVLSVSLIVGVPTGLLAGFYRGRLEKVIDWVSDVVMSLPGIVLLIALFALTGPNLVAAMTVFGLMVAPSYFRLVRSIVVGVRSELFVDAAKVAGLSDFRIIGRHVLWAVRAPVIIQSAFVLASAIGIEAGLGLLGLSDPAKASWGTMLQESFRNIYSNRWALVWPSLVIGLATLALVLLGNAVRDALQPGARETRPPNTREREQMRARFAVDADGGEGPAADALLSVRGLRIAYGVASSATEVVHGVDLDVRRGEILGLVGESGSGKSQTAFAVLGILPKEAVIVGGAVVFDGTDVLADPKQQAKVRGRRIAYIPQEPMSNLDPSYTIGAQLVYGLRAAQKMSKAEAKSRILVLLERVGIRDSERVLGQYPHEISGGMAQRVLICGAVASEPELIIADEPTTALDVTIQAEVLDLLRELRDERGLGMILVTHNFGVVADLCDSVSVMKDGVIVESGEVLSIFSDPQHPYTAQLLAATRRVDLEEVN